MAARQIKQPGPDHPITIELTQARVIVKVAGRIVAHTQDAVTLSEADYATVQYIPFGDVDRSLLEPTHHTTYCPYKGDCSYYSVPAGGDRSVNAVWTYGSPFSAVAEIKDRVAFYPDRVDEILVAGEQSR